MGYYIVQCITKESNPDYPDCRSIESIGFNAESGGITTRTPAQVYDLVENDGHTVVVKHEGESTKVHGATHGTTKYVKTAPNNTKEDNLLKQDIC